MGKTKWYIAGALLVVISVSVWPPARILETAPPAPPGQLEPATPPHSEQLAESPPAVNTTRSERSLITQTPENSRFTHVVMVEGRVVNAMGYPVQGVDITPSGGSGARVRTDEDGRYGLELRAAEPVHRFFTTFQAPGFREVTLSWELDARRYRVTADDVVLEALGPAHVVAGRVVDSRGWPVAGETVYLYSASLNQRLETVTDDSGEFRFQRVFHADDYRAWVYPQGPWFDNTLAGLELPGANPYLDITLESAGAAAVRGRLVNSAGEGIAHLAFQLESQSARGQVVSLSTDGDGYFTADGIKPGAFSLARRAAPFFMASGFAIADGELLELEIPVDIGETEVGGRVVSEWGEPIAGAEVTLAWRAIDGGQSSRSIRAAATGADGQFEFQGLDAGSRLLKVAAPGFQPREMAVENLDQEVEVQLYANNEDGY